MLALTRFCPALHRGSLPLSAPLRLTAALRRAAGAAALDGVPGASRTPPHHSSAEGPPAANPENPNHTATAQCDRKSSTFSSHYCPMNLRESLYESDLADQLRATAVARQFRSPVWATKVAFAREGHTLKEGEGDGVTVSTDAGSLVLYNLEQTNAVVAELEGYTGGRKDCHPLNAMGQAHASAVRKVIENHSNYKLYDSRFWLTEVEASIMGTCVAQEQKDCGIVIPSTPQNAHGEVVDTEPVVFFNAEQLAEPQMVTAETCVPVTCLSVNGAWYSATNSVGMRQYCRRYNLSTNPAVVFVTMKRLRALGGHLLPKVTQSTDSEGIKPFTCVWREEVLVLYHAELTNMPDDLLRIALNNRKERLDRVTAVKITEKLDGA